MILFCGLIILAEIWLIMILIAYLYFDIRKADYRYNKSKFACIVYMIIFIILSATLTHALIY